MTSPITGLPVLSAGPGAPMLTSERVRELLEFSVRYLLDVNALLALGFREHEFHSRTSAWVEREQSTSAVELISCAITELGFVRILSNERAHGVSVAAAQALLAELKRRPDVRFTFVSGDQGADRLPAWVKNSRQTDHWVREPIDHAALAKAWRAAVA